MHTKRRTLPSTTKRRTLPSTGPQVHSEMSQADTSERRSRQRLRWHRVWVKLDKLMPDRFTKVSGLTYVRKHSLPQSHMFASCEADPDVSYAHSTDTILLLHLLVLVDRHGVAVSGGPRRQLGILFRRPCRCRPIPASLNYQLALPPGGRSVVGTR